uniref:Variant surface glycoprotein 1125.4682 n=1 Tax=Trypanosoma brucei TaxID=5691 RepID=A0A1J0RAF0_9TRYP|nr:variant surface glycoprotein 1125.4682 [Trypanosoma brucei]
MNPFPAAAVTIFLTAAVIAQDQQDNCSATDFQAIYVGKLLERYAATSPPGTQHAEAAVKCRIAALLTTEKARRKRLLALSSLYQDCARREQSKSYTNLKEAAHALTNLAFAAGVADAAEALKDVSLATVAALDGGTDGTARSPVYPDSSAPGLKRTLCTPAEAQKSAKAAATKATAATTKIIFRIIRLEDGTARGTAGATTRKATLCQSDDGTCKNNGAADGGKIGLQKGKIYKTSENAADPKHGNNPSATAEKHWYTASVAAAQITAALDTAAHTSLEALANLGTPCNVWEQKADPNFIEAIATAQAESRDPAKINEEKTKIKKQTITETYGKNANEFQDKIWKQVENTPITQQNSGVKEDTTLKSISGLDQLLFLEQTITLKKKIEQQSTCSKPVVNANEEKPADPPKSADECKKHKTSEDCKKETGCEFDDKKPEGERCFPKAETEKKDEKSFSENLRVFVPQIFAALVLVEL